MVGGPGQYVRTRAPALALLGILLATGCGGPRLAPVSGRVTVAGQPATRGSVTFMPGQAQGTSGKAALGEIGPDGTYTLSTFRQGDGAIVGRHRVLVSGRAFTDAENVPPDPRIPVRYSNPQQSGVTAEVKPGTNRLDFDLKP